MLYPAGPAVGEAAILQSNLSQQPTGRFRLLVVVWAVVTVGLAVWLLWVWLNPALSATAEGTILSISRTAQNSECCPVTVEFTAANGETYTFSSRAGGTRQQQVGDTLDVYYHPDDPSRAQTGSDRLTPLAVGGFALFVLALPVFAPLIRRMGDWERKRKGLQ